MSLFLLAALRAHSSAAWPELRPHVVASDLKGGYQVVATDVNKDGKPDLIALASGMTDLVWFENPGWQRHVIASGLRRLINLAALDFDNDGIPELVVAGEFSNEARDSPGIVWRMEHQGDPRQPWRVTEIDRLPTSHRLRVANKLFVNAPLTAETAARPEYRGHVPLVFYKPGEWKRRLISDADEGVMHGIHVIDWNGDGLDDILTASFLGIHMLEARKDGTWKRTKLTSGSPLAWPKSGASDVTVGKLRGKRFLCSIEPWHGNEAVVYTMKKGAWQREVIESGFEDGHTLLALDLDKDGSDEIVAGCRGKGGLVNLYRHSGKSWVKYPLEAGGMAAAACAAADLNGDGRIDLACIGSATSNLKWYENLAPGKR